MMDGPIRISVTPAATRKLLELQGGDPARSTLRVFVAGRRCCSYRYGLAFGGAPGTGDAVQEIGGLRLVIDPASAEACSGATIDFVDGPNGSGFAVRGVRFTDGCSCGRQQAN